MKCSSILMAGVAAAAISGAMLTPALADEFGTDSNTVFRYDDQADETRALNVQALESARNQTAFPMTQHDDGDDATDGQGGRLYDGPPAPNDMGDDVDDEEDDGDEAPAADDKSPIL